LIINGTKIADRTWTELEETKKKKPEDIVNQMMHFSFALGKNI